MDHKIQNFTQSNTKAFENVIVQQIGTNRVIPILPKPPLLDESKTVTSTTTLNFNDKHKPGSSHGSSIESQSQSRPMITLEKHNTIGISNELTKLQTICTQGLLTKTAPLIINSTGNSNNQNLIKILPKLPVKTTQKSSTGNLLLQGPNNKILSLQIKSPNAVPVVVSTPNSSSVSLLPNRNSSIINLNKNMQLLKNKTSGHSIAPTILSTSSTTSTKSVKFASINIPVNQTSPSSFLSGAKVTSQTILSPKVQNLDLTFTESSSTQNVTHILNSNVTSSIRGSQLTTNSVSQMAENLLVNSNSNQQKQFSNLQQNRNAISEYNQIQSSALNSIQTTKSCNNLIASVSSVSRENLSGGENATVSINSGIVVKPKPNKNIFLPMGKISSNITISKTSLNSRHGPVEEPSPSISLIEKRNTPNPSPIPTSMQPVSCQNLLTNSNGLSSSLSTRSTINNYQKDINSHTSSKVNKVNEQKSTNSSTPSLNSIEENITVITQFIPEQKVVTTSGNEIEGISKRQTLLLSESINKKTDVINITTVPAIEPVGTIDQRTQIDDLISLTTEITMSEKSENKKKNDANPKTRSENSSINNVELDGIADGKFENTEKIADNFCNSDSMENDNEKHVPKENEKVMEDYKTINQTNNSDIGIQFPKTLQKSFKIFGVPGKNKVIKQQSLLKNKNLEILKRSPRTLGRSKSLSCNSATKKRTGRRLSTSSDNQIKSSDMGLKDLRLESSELKKNIENMITNNSKTPISPTEKSGQVLLCEEKIETSPNVSNESTSSGNCNFLEASTQNNNRSIEKITINLEKNMALNESSILENEIAHEEKKQQTSKNNNSEIENDCFISNSNSPIFIEQIISNMKPHTAAQNAIQINELANILKWRTGIGLTKDAAMAFRINELGLLEILEKNVNRNRLDIAYEKPIYQRDNKSYKTEEYIEPIYFCKGCNCHGAAIDFLAPDYCSHDCITLYEKKKGSKSSNLQQIFLNQHRQKKLRKQKMSALLNDYSISLLSNNVSPKREFTWSSYLGASNANPAPIDLFLNPFPCGPNLFQVGMKLEAIDPEYSSLFCVCSVMETKGYRLKIHFDGYSNTYDFWINADSMDLFPPGWCTKTNRALQPPKHMNPASFNWSTYLMKTKTIPAPRNLFTHLNSSSNTNPFKVGVRFEADDLRNTRKVCVASVADVLDNRILVHFDGWDDRYDYWVDCNSPYIHPVNWHLQNNFEIVPPPDWADIFDWQTYLDFINGVPATEEYFQTREPISFKIGMKLEIVDKKNPSLIRPGTVTMTDGYEIKVLFDGWSSDYAFWVVDDSPDIHPIGWCDATDHELESPPEFESLPSIMPCPVTGCRGIGNAKRFDIDFHATEDSCPYLITNWKRELEKPERINYTEIIIKECVTGQKRKRCEFYNWEIPSKYKKIENFDNNSNIVSSQTKMFKSSSVENVQRQSSIIENLSQMKIENKDENFINNSSLNTKMQLTKSLLCDYGPRLEQNYKLWLSYAQQITENLEKINTNPLQWKVDEVVSFIKKIPHCETISQLFYKEDIDGEALLSLRQKDLTDILKIKLGAAIKIYHCIILLRAEVISSFS